MSSLDFNEAGGATPFGVQLAAGQSIRPEAVYAEFEGTGAGGSFYLVLSVVSPSGVRVSSTRSPDALAAGDTGVITFAPFLGRDPSVVPPPVAGPVPFVGIETPAFNYYVGILTVTPGQDPAALTTPQAEQIIGPVCSPDGTMVAYTRAGSIWVVGTDGSGNTEIWDATTFGYNCDSLDWKKDSSGLIFCTVFGADEHKLFSIDADGSNLTTIYTDATTRSVAGPAVSPDGTLLAFIVRLSANSFGIMVANIDGTGATQIKTSATQFSQLYFSAPPFSWGRVSNLITWNDGTLAAPVWKVCNSSGGATVTIATLPSGAGRPFFHRFSSDDAYVYLVSPADLTQIRRAATDGSGVAVLHDGTQAWATQTMYAFGNRIYVQFGNELWSIQDDGTDLRDEGPALADRMKLLS